MSLSTDSTAPPLSRRELRVAFAGLMLTLTLASLDQNIVGTALPRIVSDLGGLAHLSWVVTAFMLASTATTPLYGKLSDLYGRRPLFFIAILVFVAGSALCGAARDMTQLILFRGLQGLGAGGLISLAQITISDLVSPRERSRYQGLFAAVFAVCSIAGPLLGGFLTDALSWRWIFYVNLPVGAAALALIALGVPRRSRIVAHHIDYRGAVLLTAATVCLLLLLSWGGTVHPWLSAPSFGLFAASLLLFALLILQERLSPEPILPLRLFTNAVFVVAVVVIGLTATALFGAFIFLPTFFQLVLAASPSQSGLMVAPLMGGLIVSSAVGGRVVSKTGRYKIFPIVGLVVAVLTFLALAWIVEQATGSAAIEITLALLGAGLGLVMPNLTVAIQNAVPQADLGIATSSSSFIRSLGGAFGVAGAGAFTTVALRRLVLPGAPAGDKLLAQGLDQIADLPPAAHAAFVTAYRHAIGTTFLVAAALLGAAFLIVLLLPETPLRSASPPRERGPIAPPPTPR